MNKSLQGTIVLALICIYNCSAWAGSVLHGIPWGDCDLPGFSAGTISGSPLGGTWYNYMNWSPSANGALVGSGDDRHIELSQEWYPHAAIAYFVDDSFTPIDEIWQISADMKVNNVTSNAWAEFSLHSGYDCFSTKAFSLKFSNNTITWIAGSSNGIYNASAGLTTTYKKVKLEYNPISGQAIAWIDGELVFNLTINTGLQVKTVAVSNQTTTYAPRILYIDNIRATGIEPILSGIPWGSFDSPRFVNDIIDGSVLAASGNTIGNWYSYVSWNPSAYAILEGTNANRCIKLHHSWFPQGASVYYVDERLTPLGQSWKISADLKVDPNFNNTNIAEVLFWLYDGHPSTARALFQMSICGTSLEWKAGSKEGVFTSASGLTGTYKNASFIYDPVSGSTVGLLGNEIVFATYTDTDLQVKSFYVCNINLSTTTPDEGTVYVDNIAAVPSPAAIPILHGLPCGDFSAPAFSTNKPIQAIDNNMVPSLARGDWTYEYSNATADIVGTGDSRHIELYQEGYPCYSKAYYIDAGLTPADKSWQISADMKGSWGAHIRTDSIRLFSDSARTGTPVFKMDIIGSSVNWIAGSRSGTASGIGGLTTSYQNVSIEYDPATGCAIGKIGNTQVFSVTDAGVGLLVKSVQFMNETPAGTYDNGTLFIDNVRASGVGFTGKLPVQGRALQRRSTATGVQPEVKEAYDFVSSRPAFQFTGSTVLIVENSDDLVGAELLAEDLSTNCGITVNIRKTYLPEASSFVIIGRNRNGQGCYSDNLAAMPGELGANVREGYRMVVDTGGIIIEGNDERGTLYAVETLRQLISGNGSVNCIAVRDWPAMPMRGSYCSAIVSIADVNTHIKRMSKNKTNMFNLETWWSGGQNWWYNMTGQNYTDAQTFFNFCRKFHIEPVPVVQGLGHAYAVVDLDPRCVEGVNVVNETCTLYRSVSTELIHRHVVVSPSAPILVKNTAGTITYTAGVDYNITPGTTGRPYNPSDTNYPKWQLIALSGGGIAEGQTVHVSYNYAPPAPGGEQMAYCPSEPLTYDIVDNTIHNVMFNCRPRVINIGHDEVWQKGTCSRCIGHDVNSLFYNDLMHWYDSIRSYDKDVKIMMYDDLVRNGEFGQYQANLPKDIVLLPWFYETDHPKGRQEVQSRISTQTGMGFKIAGLPSGYFVPNYNPLWFEEISQFLYPYGNVLGMMYTQWAAGDMYMLRFDDCSKDMWNGKSPRNGLDYVILTPKLIWSPRSETTSIDIYFGTNQTSVANATHASSEFKGNQTSMTYSPGTLNTNTTYYWRVDEIGYAGIRQGGVMNFITSPATSGQATTPSPSNAAVGVSQTPTFSWMPGNIVWSHDIYIGTNQTSVANATRTSAEYKGYVSHMSSPATYAPQPLNTSTTYYWRIDEIGPGGEVKGTVWNFKTN